MSNPFKKIIKKVKKVYKKVVKVVKKVVKSKIFKAVVIAVAIYYGGQVIAGQLAKASAVASTASAGAGSLAPITTAAVPNLATGVGSTMVANTAAAAAPAATGIMGTLAALTPAQAALASGVMTTGGAFMSTYAQGEAAKEEEKRIEKLRKERERNSETELNVYDRFYGDKDQRAGRVKTDASGNTIYDEAPIASLSNVEQLGGDKYYDNSTNTYSQRAAKQKKGATV